MSNFELKAIIEEKGLNQKKLAAAIGISPPFLSRIITQRDKIPRRVLSEMSRALDMPAEELKNMLRT